MEEPIGIEVKVFTSQEMSIQCINALQQVMEHFKCDLSANGLDRRAVHAWFVERYKPNINIASLTGGKI